MRAAAGCPPARATGQLYDMGTLGYLTPRQRAAMVATITASVLLFSSLTSNIVALPAIQRDFGMDSSALHWVIVVALLPLCAVAVISGRLGDVLGRRRVFLLGLVCFGTGSALCAIAPSGTLLVAARGVQGLGIALAVPLALANLKDEGGWHGGAAADRAERSKLRSIVASPRLTGRSYVAAVRPPPRAEVPRRRWLYAAYVSALHARRGHSRSRRHGRGGNEQVKAGMERNSCG